MDHQLRDLARKAIGSGRLPARKPDVTWGGPGGGHLCVICRRPVDRDDAEIEMEFAAHGAVQPQVHHAHARCFGAWELELLEAAKPAAAKSAGPLKTYAAGPNMPARGSEDAYNGGGA
ncbi:MAG TPA: hypothetical protein VFO94_00440 [Gammaproteobacteria bacterium]|nr:hypothetical protein [Gammaproteobacteria bacterium]